MTVGLVIVSHSAALAEGVRDLAGQMAPDVLIAAAGGADDGGLGTSFDKVTLALSEADTSDGVVVLFDLGSAEMVTQAALEDADPMRAERVEVVDAPLVEGAVAAAVAAQGGADRAAVAAAARQAADGWDSGVGENRGGDLRDGESEASEPATARNEPAEQATERRTATVADAAGIHARPAATLAREAAGLPAAVTLSRDGEPPTDLGNVLAVIGLGLRQGEEVVVTAAGDDAARAADRIAELISAGLDS